MLIWSLKLRLLRMFLFKMIEQLVKRHKRDLRLVLFEKARVFVARLDGVLIFQAAHRAADDVAHLPRRLVVLGRHLGEVRLGEVAVEFHADITESAERAVHGESLFTDD